MEKNFSLEWDKMKNGVIQNYRPEFSHFYLYNIYYNIYTSVFELKVSTIRKTYLILSITIILFLE